MEPANVRRKAYESMGTRWQISVWDTVSEDAFSSLITEIKERSDAFDARYSRFKKSSLVWELSRQTGIITVPRDLVAMFRIYERLGSLTDGALNPFVGFTLSDLGYDADYSFITKDKIRPVPPFDRAVRIIDDTTIELKETVLIDLGAVGKGYFVDVVAKILETKGLKRFLVDGSGDIVYRGNGVTIRAGLQDPDDSTKAIGGVEMLDGAMCASGSNLRRWNGLHHIIDPATSKPVDLVRATWVMTDSAAMADGLATCLFLAEAEPIRHEVPFEYCVMDSDNLVTCSPKFTGSIFRSE